MRRARPCWPPAPAADSLWPERRCFWGALGFKGGRAGPGAFSGCPASRPAGPEGPHGRRCPPRGAASSAWAAARTPPVPYSTSGDTGRPSVGVGDPAYRP